MVIKSVKKTTRYLSVSLALAVTAGLSGCGGDVATDTDFDSVDVTSPVSDWKMVWSDEFDGTSIDSSKWTHEVNCSGGGNQEQQCYTDTAENSFVSDGTLKIVAMPAEDGADLPYTSARMVTKDKGDWKYGRFEIRAKLPFGQGTWPAFWMLSTDEVYGTWPRSGEIDIMEAVNLKEIGPDGMAHNSTVGQLYYGSGTPNQDFQFDSSGTTYAMPDGVSPADDFHTYAVEWQEGEIRWYVDDYLFQTQRQSELKINSSGVVTGLNHKGWYAEFFDIITGQLEDHWDSAPFDQDFHILLNLAIGGAFPGNTNNAANFPDTNGIDPAALANGQTFEIDYVRVYECSLNPLTGKGCETTRAGFQTLKSDDNPDGALVLGVAPTPPPPPGGPAIPITIFGDAVNPAWPLWDSSDNTTPMTTMDPDRGEVAQFNIIDNAGAVLGFNTRITDSPAPYNGNGMLASGNFSFDMKVVTAPTAGGPWILKLEADNNTSDTGDIPLTSSIEGQAPVTGQWQTYTFSVKSLNDAGLELGLIDLIMIFPTWGTGEGAEYLVDNVKFTADGVVSPELVLFEDAALPGWPLWDCCAGSVPSIETDDAEHGQVIEFDVLGNAETVQGFFGRGGPDLEADPFDATAIQSNGVVQFEMKIVSGATTGTVPWIFKLEADGNTSDTGDIDLSTSVEGVAPVEGVWQTYTFKLSDLAATGIDLSAIDVVMIFPAWGQGGGAIYRVDNVKFYDPDAGSGGNGGGTETVTETFYDDALADGLAFNFFDNGAGTLVYSEVAEDDRGSVIEVVKSGPDGNFYFEAGDYDLTPWQAQGELVFDLNVLSSDDGVSVLVKFDSGWPNVSDYAITLPTTGEWGEIRIPVADILANSNSFDPSGIADPSSVVNIFVIEPNGVMTFRLDNVRLEIPGSGGTDPVDPPATTNTFFDDAIAEGLNYNFFDNGAGTLTFGEQAEDGRGTVIQVAKTGPDGNFYFESAGTDLSSYVASGELVFDINVVSTDDGVTFLVKFDSGWPNVSDYTVALPATGEWGEIRIAVADIFANSNSLDPSGIADPTSVINVFVVEPSGVMTFKLDNVRLEN